VYKYPQNLIKSTAKMSKVGKTNISPPKAEYPLSISALSDKHLVSHREENKVGT